MKSWNGRIGLLRTIGVSVVAIAALAGALAMSGCEKKEEAAAADKAKAASEEAAEKVSAATAQAKKAADEAVAAADKEAAAALARADEAIKGAEGATAAEAAKPAAAAAAAAPTAPAMEWEPVELKTEEGEFVAMMTVPKGAKAADSFGTLEVKLGDGKDFFVQIETDATGIDELKEEVESNDVQKLQKFHVDTADTLIYETEAFGRRSFWLDHNIKVGDQLLHCYSGRGANSYTKEQVEMFLRSCQSLAAKQ